jgi:hypothetical protein
MEATLEFKTLPDFINLVEYDSMSEILRDAKTNWLKGSLAISEIFKNLPLFIEPLKYQKEFIPDVTGLFFDIGLVCSGVPESWLNPILPTNNGSFLSLDPNDELEVINLGINITTPSSFSEASIIERGAVFALLAYLLEQSGRAVTITQYCALTKNNNNFYGSVLLKNKDQYVDLNLLSFWLASPNSLRGCWAKIFENFPDMERNKFEKPLKEYGVDASNIFMHGSDSTVKEWSREDSIKWICDRLQNQNIKYHLDI